MLEYRITKPMKVIVDNKIPYLKGVLEEIVDQVVYLPGAAFTPEQVKDADALIVRTRTHCNRELLEGSSVKFIATATIGFDHIDRTYCCEAGITWTNCPGCNAGSVEQYIHAVLLLLKKVKGLDLSSACLGIVGVGHVGSRVQRMAESLGMRVLLNDPPREANGEEGFVDLETLARECDVITCHTPLNREGAFGTYHLANREFFQSLQRKPYFINSSRGEVVDTAALLEALNEGWIKEAVIDTWENEPHISLELLNRVFIGTPHIAGYSADGKANASRMSLHALCEFFHLPCKAEIVPPSLPEMEMPKSPDEAFLLQYNPQRDSDWLKAEPDKFEWFRGNYPLRRE